MSILIHLIPFIVIILSCLIVFYILKPFLLTFAVLSSVSALLMMVTLKRLASTGYTLILTIYQSSTEVFGLFDRICLLSNGNTLFFGETLACLQVISVHSQILHM